MADIMRQIVTPLANQAAAIALSTPQGGIPQSLFVAMATTNATGHSPTATHCWTSGWIDENIIALFVADPANYDVTSFGTRQAFQALATHTPTLYPYLGP